MVKNTTSYGTAWGALIGNGLTAEEMNGLTFKTDISAHASPEGDRIKYAGGTKVLILRDGGWENNEWEGARVEEIDHDKTSNGLLNEYLQFLGKRKNCS